MGKWGQERLAKEGKMGGLKGGKGWIKREKRVDKAGWVETKERDEWQCPERGVGN